MTVAVDAGKGASPCLRLPLARAATPWGRRAARACLAGLALALPWALTGCGGGDQVKTFKPANVVSFGDDHSVLAAVDVNGSGALKGLKYTIDEVLVLRGTVITPNVPSTATNIELSPQGYYPNVPQASPAQVAGTDGIVLSRFLTLDVTFTDNSVVTTNPGSTVQFDDIYDCGANRLWIQLLANAYGLGYKGQCSTDSAYGAVSHAQGGATVADVAAQVALHRGELNGNTLVTMLAGQNDILAAYDSVRAGSSTDVAAKAALRLKGQQLGAIINDIIKTGARVVFMTVPDLGYSPKARADGASELMSSLVVAFNDGLTGTGGVKNDGHFVGRVKGFEQVRTMAKDPASYGLINSSDAACNAAYNPADGSALAATDARFALYCNSVTLRSGATAYNHLWADATHLSPAAHASLGNLAYIRARDNPF